MPNAHPIHRLTKAELTKIRSLIDAQGEKPAAQLLGIHVGTLARALAGLPLVRSTFRIIRLAVAEQHPSAEVRPRGE